MCTEQHPKVQKKNPNCAWTNSGMKKATGSEI